HGAIETVTSHVCTRGIKVSFTVTFSSLEAIEKIMKLSTSSLFVGTEHARFGRIGDHRVNWQTGFVRKLAGLPRQTTPLDLAELLEIKATFIDVPKHFSGKRVLYRREAFVYFQNEADMMAAMSKNIKLMDKPLEWCDIETKTCYHCGSSEHIKADCVDAQESKELRARVIQVKSYQDGRPLPKLVKRATAAVSYASAVGSAQQRSGVAGTQQQTAHNIAHSKQTIPTREHADRVDQLIALLEKEREENRRQREEDKQRFDAMLSMMTSMMAFVMQSSQTTPQVTQQLEAKTISKDNNNDRERNSKEKTTISSNATVKTGPTSTFPTPQTPTETLLSALAMMLPAKPLQRHALPAVPTHKMTPQSYSGYNNE
ncbi:hypothetical protein BGX28_000181, partial [Mortierella sp. GBA30]